MLEQDVQLAVGKFLSVDSKRIDNLGNLCTELSVLAPFIKRLSVKLGVSLGKDQTWVIDSDRILITDFIDHLGITRFYPKRELGRIIGSRAFGYQIEVPIDGNIKIIGDRPWYTGTYAQDWRPGKDITGLSKGGRCTIYSPAKFPTNPAHLSGYTLTLQNFLKDLSYARLSS